MRTCIHCGGSVRGKEFGIGCKHEFDDPPKAITQLIAKIIPAKSLSRRLPPRTENIWQAMISLGSLGMLRREHPLKDEAVRLVEEAWRVERDKKPEPEPEKFPEGLLPDVQGLYSAWITLAKGDARQRKKVSDALRSMGIQTMVFLSWSPDTRARHLANHGVQP